MKIKLINKKVIKDLTVEENTSIAVVLKDEDIALETVVVRLNGETVTEEEILNDGDELEVIKVIYGG